MSDEPLLSYARREYQTYGLLTLNTAARLMGRGYDVEALEKTFDQPEEIHSSDCKDETEV